MTAETLAVLEHAAFAPLFAAGSRAEIPIVGRITLPGGARVPVSGQIDRLAAGADAVWIGDFKTDRAPPRSAAAAPAPYRLQLALYRAVLAGLYPGRPIRAALVFTQTPQLLEIPAGLLDEALAALAATPS
jgi:ATP-dependent helicase/nuclease subunit A